MITILLNGRCVNVGNGGNIGFGGEVKSAAHYSPRSSLAYLGQLQSVFQCRISLTIFLNPITMLGSHRSLEQTLGNGDEFCNCYDPRKGTCEWSPEKVLLNENDLRDAKHCRKKEYQMNKKKYEQRSARSYQKIADDYDNSPEGHYTLDFKHLLMKIVQIPDGGNVLDVACGNGRLLEMLSRKHRFSGFGVDLSDKMVENASRINPTMVFQQASCDALPFQSAYFDTLTVCAAYHHFPDVNAFAKEAYRVLKPNGRLYIAEVYYPKLLRILFNPLIRHSRAGDVRLYGPDEIDRVFEKAGFHAASQHFQKYIQVLGYEKA